MFGIKKNKHGKRVCQVNDAFVETLPCICILTAFVECNSRANMCLSKIKIKYNIKCIKKNYMNSFADIYSK